MIAIYSVICYNKYGDKNGECSIYVNEQNKWKTIHR